MKLQRFLVALTVLNLGLLAFLLAQIEVRFLGFRFLRWRERPGFRVIASLPVVAYPR